MKADAHTKRIRRELRQAGVGRIGFLRFGIRYLPKIIHQDEHICGVAYGRYREAGQLMAWEEGTLVATDRRILFIDRKPGYIRADDIAYDVVAAVEASKAGPFSAVTLYTKMGNLTLRFTRANCAEIFVKYVEDRRLEIGAVQGEAHGY